MRKANKLQGCANRKQERHPYGWTTRVLGSRLDAFCKLILPLLHQMLAESVLCTRHWSRALSRQLQTNRIQTLPLSRPPASQVLSQCKAATIHRGPHMRQIPRWTWQNQFLHQTHFASDFLEKHLCPPR